MAKPGPWQGPRHRAEHTVAAPYALGGGGLQVQSQDLCSGLSASCACVLDLDTVPPTRHFQLSWGERLCLQTEAPQWNGPNHRGVRIPGLCFCVLFFWLYLTKSISIH